METSSNAFVYMLAAALLGLVLGMMPQGTPDPTGTVAPEPEQQAPQTAPLAPTEPEEAPTVELEALEVLEVAPLSQTHAANELAAQGAFIETLTGQITYEGEVHAYELAAQATGTYYIQFDELYAGFEPNCAVFNAWGERVKGYTWGIANGGGINVDLEEGQTYRLEVQQYEGTGSYTMTVFHQKPAVDVSTARVVHDAVEFTDQVIGYAFTPAETGVYRFDFAEMRAGFEVDLAVVDRLGYTVDSTSWGLGNGSGLTANLEGGEPYRLYVTFSEGTGSYQMSIGHQKPLLDVTSFDVVVDSIEFTNQQNVYTLACTQTGTYTLTLNGMPAATCVSVDVYSDLGERVGASFYGAENGDVVEFDLVAGEVYSIYATHDEGLGAYTMQIGRPTA